MLSDLLPDTVRGFVVLSFVTSTALLVLFGTTRFLPFVFLALIAFLVGFLLTSFAIWERFQDWLGWTQQEE
ncbi:hypothetical protein VB773_17370 [Haloarculaceae archaeon H-GB2-1]|nr:hypothetical protein [Haloarculaceae archaeon H-GB1-1]MEA5387680.1 hypothetical protein [Haloarculaceae archaeon H-GB11]MEA5409167.1 hypothetical protein [Haloarculaceae archaeon H-GB2-1]